MKQLFACLFISFLMIPEAQAHSNCGDHVHNAWRKYGRTYKGMRLFKSTGNRALDRRVRTEAKRLIRFFGVRPNLYILDDRRTRPNAFASSRTTRYGTYGTIYLGFKLLTTELWNTKKGPLAVAGIMAHEFAHIYQYKNGLKRGGKYQELHADYLAGYYICRRKYMHPYQMNAFAYTLYQKGDYNLWSRTHHGTPRERVRAMLAGCSSKKYSLYQAYRTGWRFIHTRGRRSRNPKCTRVCRPKRICRSAQRCHLKRVCVPVTRCRREYRCSPYDPEDCGYVRICRRVSSCSYRRFCRRYPSCYYKSICKTYCR